MRRWIIAAALTALAGATAAGESAAERGRNAITGKTYIPAIWSRGAYDKLWTRWAKEKPADYDAAVREVYGLHPAPYANGGLPMGLRNAPRFFQAGLAIDCLACHGGATHGQSHLGLGNSVLDVQAVFEDLNAVDGLPALPFRFSNSRGTSEAGTMSVYLIGKRNPDLTFRARPVALGVHDDMCEDVPAWWLLKKKKTMYFTGQRRSCTRHGILYCGTFSARAARFESSCSAPNGHSQPQNGPRPQKSSAAATEHHRMKTSGSTRNDDQRKPSRKAVVKVSTLTTES